MSLTKLLTGHDVYSETVYKLFKLLKKRKEDGATLEDALVGLPEKYHHGLKDVWPDLAPTRFNG